MKRTLFVVAPLALMVVVGLVWASAVIGAKAPTSSANLSGAVGLDCGTEPIAYDVQVLRLLLELWGL